MELWQIVLGSSGLVGGLGILGGVIASRRRNTDQARREREITLGERWDDGIDLAERIRVEVEKQVEAQMKPIREKMARMETESHEMNDAVRATATEQWLWDQTGRPGSLPMLPGPILERLGLGRLLPANSADPREGMTE